MRSEGFYPVLLTDDVARSSSFFTEHMGFRGTFTSDWYVSLVHGGNDAYELAIISHDPGGVQAAHLRAAPQLRGAERGERARATPRRGGGDPAARRGSLGRAATLHLPWPGGVMVDVIEVVPPDPEYADRYVS